MDRDAVPRGGGAADHGGGERARLDRRAGNSFLMAKTFGFSDDELKLLLVAVRQMRRTFAKARKTDAALEAYASLYDGLFEKLHDMTGPLPDTVEDVIE
jgi:hypothetical protein